MGGIDLPLIKMAYNQNSVEREPEKKLIDLEIKGGDVIHVCLAAPPRVAR